MPLSVKPLTAALLAGAMILVAAPERALRLEIAPTHAAAQAGSDDARRARRQAEDQRAWREVSGQRARSRDIDEDRTEPRRTETRRARQQDEARPPRAEPRPQRAEEGRPQRAQRQQGVEEGRRQGAQRQQQASPGQQGAQRRQAGQQQGGAQRQQAATAQRQQGAQRQRAENGRPAAARERDRNRSTVDERRERFEQSIDDGRGSPARGAAGPQRQDQRGGRAEAERRRDESRDRPRRAGDDRRRRDWERWRDRPDDWRRDYYRPHHWRPHGWRPYYYAAPYWRRPDPFWGDYYYTPYWGWYFIAPLATTTLVYAATLPTDRACEDTWYDGEQLIFCEGVLYRPTTYRERTVYEIASAAPEDVDPSYGAEAGVEAGGLGVALRLATPLMRGDAVRRLQDELAGLGYLRGPVDGVFGPGTDRAVRDFQRDQRLAVNGIVEGETAYRLGL